MQFALFLCSSMAGKTYIIYFFPNIDLDLYVLSYRWRGFIFCWRHIYKRVIIQLNKSHGLSHRWNLNIPRWGVNIPCYHPESSSNYFQFQLEVISGLCADSRGPLRPEIFGNLAQARLKTGTVIELSAAQRQQTLSKDQNTGRMRSDKIQLNLITGAVV